MHLSPFFVAEAEFFEIYGDGSLEHVGDTIGGKVKQNIDAGIFENACAIRMSYVLNQCGAPIYQSSSWETVSGSEGEMYIFRVQDIHQFLETNLGKPESFRKPTPGRLEDSQGILLFNVSGWNNATGHITLWNGMMCSDECYFSPTAPLALLWKLS